MTRRGTTNSTRNLGGGVLILVKNGLSYTSLSTQSLSSLDPSSDYLAIAVKIKGAAPIHLFNVNVPPIRSSSSDSRPKSFSPFLLPSSPTTYIFGDFNSHHSSWNSHSPEDHSGKDLFDWLLSSDLLPLNNPEHHTLLHRATGNRPAKAWWSPEVADAVAKRRKAFAKAHCPEEDRQHYIATSRYTSTVISKAKAKSWQKTCSSLSPKTRPSEVFSLLCFISGSPSPNTSDLPKLPYPCRLCQSYLFTSTVPFLYPNPKSFSKH